MPVDCNDEYAKERRFSLKSSNHCLKDPAMRFLTIALIVCFATVGCQYADTKTDSQANSSHSHDDGTEHEHKEVASTSHVHADGSSCTCELGENGGHLFAFENKEFKGEYVISKDSDVVRFFLLNAKDEDVSLKVDSFKVTPLAGADAVAFELEADSPDGDGKSHIFMAENKDLRIALNLGVQVEVKSGDTLLTGTIDAHEASDH
jgi:hypothetical protein